MSGIVIILTMYRLPFVEKLGVEERGGYYDHSGIARYGAKSHTSTPLFCWYGQTQKLLPR